MQLAAVGPPPGVPAYSLGRSSSLMAIASLASRVTGFLRQIALVAVLGFGLVNSSYTVANTLPNIVYELLLGGVLTSVMIPLLVRAQTEDADGGEVYTRRLITLAAAGLTAATAVAMLAAPLLTRLYLGTQTSTGATSELATAFAYLLLPQIVFYGLGALLGAILNSRGVFGPFAWAPVLNNVVVLGVLGVYVLVPGPISLDPVRMGDTKLLVLGLGTTLGIVVQAAVLLPAMRRIGFRYRPTWGWDPRLTAAGGLAVWVVAYVLIGQVGYAVTNRVAFDADPAGPAIYANAWLLLQVPYGILGVSLLTALMPRMSRAAAQGRSADVVADLSLGTRLSALVLVPVSVLLTLFGTEVGLALFGWRDGNVEGAARLGTALAFSAFGLLPFAVMMLQLRVFYALTDSRTPTVIQLTVVAVKVPLLLACPLVLPPEQVVVGLMAVNSASFVFGAVLGQVLVRRRLGPLRTGTVLGSVARTVAGSVAGGLAALAVLTPLAPVVDGWPIAAAAWTVLGLAVLVAAPVTLGALRLLRSAELESLRSRIRGLARRAGAGRGRSR
ncbi:MAG TPA: murein biosynthesis integral membrane protein MurJ [Pseudonocardia sp.]|nr:murein biosynthesis integral membrane protein MurJ [Pseudonocardia sp.]